MSGWFVYDAYSGDVSTCDTEAEALKLANALIDSCRDADGWPDEVESIFVGRVTHKATEVNRRDRPDDLDEDGYDSKGEYWDRRFDYVCDYAMRLADES